MITIPSSPKSVQGRRSVCQSCDRAATYPEVDIIDTYIYSIYIHVRWRKIRIENVSNHGKYFFCRTEFAFF